MLHTELGVLPLVFTGLGLQLWKIARIPFYGWFTGGLFFFFFFGHINGSLVFHVRKLWTMDNCLWQSLHYCWLEERARRRCKRTLTHFRLMRGGGCGSWCVKAFLLLHICCNCLNSYVTCLNWESALLYTTNTLVNCFLKCFINKPDLA